VSGLPADAASGFGVNPAAAGKSLVLSIEAIKRATASVRGFGKTPFVFALLYFAGEEQ